VASDFDCAPELLWDLFHDEEYERRLHQQTGVRTTVVKHVKEGETEQRIIEVVNDTELPRFVQKALGSRQLTYEQHSTLDRGSNTLSWTVLLPVMRDKVTVQGKTRVMTHGSGSRRTVDGEVSVRIPLVGGRVEKAIAERFQESFGRAANIVRDLVRERGLQS